MLNLSMITNVSGQSFTAEIAPGMMNVKAEEMAYNPATGNKISQLNWKTTGTPIVNAALNWYVIPEVSIGLSGWTTLSERSSTMSDYDWNGTGKGWVDRSSSSNTKLNYANEFDVNATYWLMPESRHQLGLRLGYQESRFSWTSSGGNYIYHDNGQVTTGSLPDDKPGVGYSQKLVVPYAAVTGKYVLGKFDINMIAKYSPYARLKDSDQHYLRDIHFTDDVKNADYYGLSVNAGYAVMEATRAYLGMNYNYYPSRIGSSREYNKMTGQSKSGGDGSSGISNTNWQLMAGVSFTM